MSEVRNAVDNLQRHIERRLKGVVGHPNTPGLWMKLGDIIMDWVWDNPDEQIRENMLDRLLQNRIKVIQRDDGHCRSACRNEMCGCTSALLKPECDSLKDTMSVHWRTKLCCARCGLDVQLFLVSAGGKDQ